MSCFLINYFCMEPAFLSEFSELPKNVWQRKLEGELKGRSLDEVMYRVAGSVVMAPYQVEADLAAQPLHRDVQASQRQAPGWLTLPIVGFDTPKETNQRIRHQLARGADGVWLHCGSVPLSHLESVKTLHAIRLTDTPVFLDSPEWAPEIIGELTQGSSYYVKGGIVHDPLAVWMRTGRGYQDAFDAIAEGMTLTKAMREFRSYKVENHVFHEAGADVVQELAYTLASFVTCMDELTERGVAPLLAANRFVFSVSVGTGYLSEIGKFRALRYLYRKVTRAYGLPDELCQAFIQGQSSRLYQSARSPYTNMVRHASEAMSAVMGGCDALSILPFDAGYAESGSEFSERVARNVSLVLKNESYLDKVADPAVGAYYLEILTLKLAEAAWEMFLGIEEKGGLPRAFEQNHIQEKIGEAWNEKVESYHGAAVMVGVNQFRQEEETVVPVAPPSSEDLSPNWEYALLRPVHFDQVL